MVVMINMVKGMIKNKVKKIMIIMIMVKMRNKV